MLQVLHPQHLWRSRRPHCSLVPRQCPVLQSVHRRLSPPNGNRHAHAPPRPSLPTHPFLDLLIQYHQRIHADCQDSKTGHKFSNTTGTRTEGTAPEQRVLPPAQLKLVPPPRRPGICHSQQIANLQPQHQLAQTATATGPYAHHISNLVTVLPTTGKQGSLKKLLQGSDTKIWTKGLANAWDRLLLHGPGLDRPPDERITGTGTIFFTKK
jgi:hypothetical protein